MSTTLRKRCLIMRIIEREKGLANVDSIDCALPEMGRQNILKAINQMLCQDRLFKNGKRVSTVSGRLMTCYRVNPDWEPGAPRNETPAQERRRLNAGSKKPFKGEKGQLATNTRQSLGVVMYRERKVQLLLRLLENLRDTDRDLMLGLLADLGHRAE